MPLPEFQGHNFLLTDSSPPCSGAFCCYLINWSERPTRIHFTAVSPNFIPGCFPNNAQNLKFLLVRLLLTTHKHVHWNSLRYSICTFNLCSVIYDVSSTSECCEMLPLIMRLAFSLERTWWVSVSHCSFWIVLFSQKREAVRWGLQFKYKKNIQRKPDHFYYLLKLKKCLKTQSVFVSPAVRYIGTILR